MTTDIALNNYHDIYLDTTNDLVLAFDPEQVAQSLKIRLLSYLGEWFLNTNDGTPYFQSILGQIYRPQNASAIIRKRILDTEGVDKLLKFDFNLTNRKLSISASVKIGDSVSSITINETL
jgi:DNA-binding phage protein